MEQRDKADDQARHDGSSDNIGLSVQAWIDAVKRSGGKVSDERIALVRQLVQALKECGAWDRLDCLWIFAAENEAQALIDIIGGHKATALQEPLFSVGKGYIFDGVSQYIDCNFSGIAPGARYSINDASFGGYVFAPPNGSAGVEFGNDYTSYSMLSIRWGSSRRFQVNSRTDAPYNVSLQYQWTGHFHCQRVAADRTELYRDAVLEGFSNEPSFAVPRMTFHVGCGRGRLGPSGSYSSASISTAHIGSSLSANQIVGFDQAIRTFLAAAAIQGEQQKHSGQIRATKPPKIAVCLSGALRTFARCAPSIRAFFGDVDYFGTFWSWDRNRIFPSEDSEAYLPFKALNFQEQPRDLAVKRLNIPNANVVPMLLGMKMNYDFFKSVVDPKEYDLVFRCRPDLLFQGHVTDFVEIMKEERVYLPDHSTYTGYCDQFAGGPPHLMEALFSTIGALSEYEGKASEPVYVEFLLKYWLDKKGIEVRELPFDFKICRQDFVGMPYEDIPRDSTLHRVWTVHDVSTPSGL